MGPGLEQGSSLPEYLGRSTVRAELVRCYDASTAENRHSLVVAARNAALASGEAAKRDPDVTQEVSTHQSLIAKSTSTCSFA